MTYLTGAIFLFIGVFLVLPLQRLLSPKNRKTHFHVDPALTDRMNQHLLEVPLKNRPIRTPAIVERIQNTDHLPAITSKEFETSEPDDPSDFIQLKILDSPEQEEKRGNLGI
jgi:hypothetical protein